MRTPTTRRIRNKAVRHARAGDCLALLQQVQECCDEIHELRAACRAMLELYDESEKYGYRCENFFMPSIAWDKVLECLGETYGDRI